MTLRERWPNPDKSELINAICKAATGEQRVSVARIYLKSRNHRNEFPVYHVHGLIPQENQGIVSTLILSEREYHEMYKEAYNWSIIEQLHALDRNTCFFIGISMTDPNLRRLLDISRMESDHESRHFAFLKRESLFKPEEIEKNKLHFNTIESQLCDLGVQVIWYEDHKEVPEILRKIIAPLQ